MKRWNSRRTSRSYTHRKSKVRCSQAAWLRAVFRPPRTILRAEVERLANPPPRLKPEELVAWIIRSTATHGRRLRTIDKEELASFLNDFDLARSEREAILGLVLRLRTQEKTGRKNSSNLIIAAQRNSSKKDNRTFVN
jgi:hypothetical protein